MSLSELMNIYEMGVTFNYMGYRSNVHSCVGEHMWCYNGEKHC